jgi:hypothetical protein
MTVNQSLDVVYVCAPYDMYYETDEYFYCTDIPNSAMIPLCPCN